MLVSLRAAGEETRLRLLVLLSQGEQTVKDITTILEQSQPRISRHLKLLLESGLVERYQEGSWVYYRLADHSGVVACLIKSLLNSLDEKQGIVAEDKKRSEAVGLERKAVAQQYFQKNAAQWDKIRGLHVAETQVEQAMMAMLGMDEEKPITFDLLVDLGTGTGRILELFSDYFRHAIGFDLNKDMLSYARENLAQAGLSHYQLRQGELCDIALEDKMADVVVIHQVLHFLEKPAGAILEASRILKQGGQMLIVDFARHDLDFLREKQAHRRLGFTDVQMRAWMCDAGLTVQQHQGLKPDNSVSGDQLTVSLWQGEKMNKE